jgi:hypothetical protein
MYSIILNSNNRIDKTNTNANDCEYNFDWHTVLKEEGKYKVTYSLSKFFIRPLTPFESLISQKVPWGLWKATNYNSTTQKIIDASPNGRDAICTGINLVTSAIGNLNTVPVPALNGLKTSSIVFPPGSIPSVNTICCLTRYTNPLVKGRLLAGAGSNNYNFGAYRGEIPTIYEGSSNTQGCDNSSGLVNGSLNWLNACAIRGNTVLAKNQVLINKIPSGTNYLMSTSIGQLAINNYFDSADSGDFEMACVIVFDQALTASELVVVSNSIDNYLNTGVLN